jgi:MHS family proline/betaine transporter-like MFS transporter
MRPDQSSSIDAKPPERDRPASLLKVIAAGSVGALVEWYDFAVYAYLATLLASLFFPSSDPTTALLSSLAVFGVGFVLRPVGGLLFGHYGDKYGRRNALAAAIIVMAAATLVIAVLPTYDQVGVLAPILLVVARMAQGIAAGGEWGGGTAFLVEYAPANRKGLYGSLHQFATIGGFVCGIVMASAVNGLLTTEALHSYGWRIPFLVGALGALVGLYLRRRTQDTPDFRLLEDQGAVARAPVVEVFSKHLRSVSLAGGVVLGWTIAYYALIGMPSFLAGVIGVSLSAALMSNLIAMVVHLALLPVTGALADRLGYLPLLIASTVGLGVVAYPVYALVSQKSFGYLVLGQVVFAAVLAVFSGPAPAALAELFPTRVRHSSLSIGYNLATALFGGTAPFIVAFLVSRTGNALAPAFYVIAGAVVTTAVLASTSGAALRAGDQQEEEPAAGSDGRR